MPANPLDFNFFYPGSARRITSDGVWTWSVQDCNTKEVPMLHGHCFYWPFLMPICQMNLVTQNPSNRLTCCYLAKRCQSTKTNNAFQTTTITHHVALFSTKKCLRNPQKFPELWKPSPILKLPSDKKGAHPITSHEKYPHDRFKNHDDSIKKTSSYPHHSPVLPIKCHSKSVNPCTVNPIISQ